MRQKWIGAWMLVMWAAAGQALAAPVCRAPVTPPRATIERPRADEPRRTVAIGGYTLAMIWAPQQCRRAVPGASSFRCGRDAAGRRFLLHGLWPDGEGASWPQWCRPSRQLPPAVVRASWCATPSAQLLQHEWAKHGTCVPGATPARYFADARALFGRVRAPDMAGLSRTDLTRADFTRALVAANPGLPADAVRVRTDRRGWLEEVWLCLDRRRAYARCRQADDGGAPVLIWRGPA